MQRTTIVLPVTQSCKPSFFYFILGLLSSSIYTVEVTKKELRGTFSTYESVLRLPIKIFTTHEMQSAGIVNMVPYSVLITTR